VLVVTFHWLLEKFDLGANRSTGLYANKAVLGTTKETAEAHWFDESEKDLALELAAARLKCEAGMEWRITEHGFL
jgi:hypothetical protein